jgi:membrane associated rhomboid family serine protease
MTTAPVGGTPARRRAAALQSLPWKPAAATTIAFTALLYVVEAINSLDHQHLDGDGIRPRSVGGLTGIVWAPVLHAGWEHLAGNTVPALVLGFLTLLSGIGRGLLVTAIVWVVAGLGTWLIAPTDTVHLGASSLIFGWLAFLVVRGVFNRSLSQVVLGLVLLVAYGSVLWGALPGRQGISWQGHLFGAIGGVLAAAVTAGRRNQPGRPAPPALPS